MAITLALVAPLIGCGLLVIALISATDPPVVTGLAEDQRLGLMLLMPPLYLVGSMWASTVYASWLWGSRPLPRWLQAPLEAPDPHPRRGPRWSIDGRLTVPATAGWWERIWLAFAVFISASLLLALFVPLYAIFLLWLRSDVYRPWEAMIWSVAGIGTLAWPAFLAYRYLMHR